MSVLTVLQAPWAIRPEFLNMMWDIYDAHLSRGGKLSADQIQEIEAATGKKLDGRSLPTTVHDGVAVIPVMGPMIPRANMFQAISGATSYTMIRNDLEAARDDSSVVSAVLNFDTPGGPVNQLFGLADDIRRFSAIKPIASWTDGYMTSAGQLLGAATGESYIGSDTTELGSIGVLGRHRDISKAEEMRGEKTTILYSGRYKAVGHPFAPLSSEDQAHLQGRLDYLYTAFVNAMGGYLGIEAKKVAEEMADARIFTGRQAIDIGLARDLLSFEDMLAMMRDKGQSKKRSTVSMPGGRASAENQRGERTMTRAELQEQHPALYTEIFEEGKKAGLAGAETVVAEAVTSERNRVMTILEIPGPAAQAHKALLVDGIKEGMSAGDVALSIQKKEAELLGDAEEGMRKGAPKAAPPAGPGDDDEGAAKVGAFADEMVKGAEAWAQRN